MGTANVDALKKLQRSVDEYTPASKSGRGLCYLGLFTYGPETDLGTYQEIAITHIATPSDQPHTFNFDITDHDALISGFEEILTMHTVNDALWLDSDLGIAAGTQIWGYPKLKATFAESSEETETGALRQVITVTDVQSGKQVLHMNLPDPETFSPACLFLNRKA